MTVEIAWTKVHQTTRGNGMALCPACRKELPQDARFCGFCGFRLSPITQEALRRISQNIQPLVASEPVLLTQKKAVTVPPLPPPSPLLPISPEVKTSNNHNSSSFSLGSLSKLGISSKKNAEEIIKTEEEKNHSQTVEDVVPLKTKVEELSLESSSQDNNKSETPPLVDSNILNSREFRRFPLKVEVGYTSDHNFYTGFMENLSSGGLFVATHSPGNIGDVLELTFTVPGLEGICTAMCKVRWIREYNPLNPESVPGMGLQFYQLDADARSAIEIFIKHREPIFFDDD